MPRYVKKFYMWYEVAPRGVGNTGKYRVMVFRPGPEEFHIYVDEKYKRVFLIDDLPDKVKESLAMIHSFDWSRMIKDFYIPPLEWKDSLPEYLQEIGWKTSDNEYCVIMDKSLLDELRGDSVTNVTVRKAP